MNFTQIIDVAGFCHCGAALGLLRALAKAGGKVVGPLTQSGCQISVRTLWEEWTMTVIRRTLAIAGAVSIALGLLFPAQAGQAADDPGIGSGPELPVLRPHDEPDEGRGREARQHHRHRERRPGSDAQADRRRRDGDHPGRRRHRHQPERGRRHGAGAAGRRSMPAFRSSPSTGASTRCRASSPMSAPTTSRAARRRAS